MNKRNYYTLKLITLAPVHIGDGHTYTNKDYIEEKDYYYFPEMESLYAYIKKTNPRIVSDFERFLMSKQRVHQFIKKYRINYKNLGGYRIRKTGFEPKNLVTVSRFIRNSYGAPYIPGSSLKGALRTVLENEWDASEVEEICSHLIIRDSQSINNNKLILSQKFDYNVDKEISEKNPRPMPIMREAISPATIISFDVVTTNLLAKQAFDQIVPLIKSYENKYYEKVWQDVDPSFYKGFPKLPSIYLGGGSGFWTKTDIDNADPSRHQKRSSKTRMIDEGVRKLTKAPIIKVKHASLIDNEDNFYEMGKCAVTTTKKEI